MGRLSGALKCIKYLLLTFNFIFLLAGTAVIAIGIWLRYDGAITGLSTEDEDIRSSFFIGLYILIGAGVLMMIIGFFGCCGAARESQCLLGSFFACLLVIFAAEVTAGAVAFLSKDVTISEIQKSYSESYKNYEEKREGNKTLIEIHDLANCCGTEDPESAKLLSPLCSEKQKEHKDCLQEIKKVFHHSFQIIGILAISTAGITIFGMIFSMVLCCAIRNSRDML
ncbi:tetraspanin-2 [Rhinophrynus dorsalis]